MLRFSNNEDNEVKVNSEYKVQKCRTILMPEEVVCVFKAVHNQKRNTKHKYKNTILKILSVAVTNLFVIRNYIMGGSWWRLIGSKLFYTFLEIL